MIVLQGVGKDYAGHAGICTAVGQVDLTVADSEFVSIVGPSGCGKSSLLNMIAGFVAPTRGAVSVYGQPVNGCLPRALGYIFQKDTLLPWYTVRQNIGLGLGFHGIQGARGARRVLLLDEPFSALDMHTRAHLHGELAALWRRLGQTVVMVTHDLDEAVLLSDRVIVLSGSPSQVLAEEVIDLPRPRNVFSVRATAAFAAHTRKIWSVLGEQFKART